MLGDGINDSTALATATVGAAMGETSAALAANSADLVLMTDKLQRLTQCIRLCRYALWIERLNIILPCFVKLVEVGFALVGRLELWMAIVADLGTLLLVLVLGLSVLSRRFWTDYDYVSGQTMIRRSIRPLSGIELVLIIDKQVVPY